MDLLIGARQEENLPGLSEIYAALRNASYSDYVGRSNAYGWLLFDRYGHSFSIRVYCKGENWLIASLQHRDAHDQVTEMQRHVGERVADHLPRGATNIVLSPDHPARPEPKEMPTKEQQAALFTDRISEGCGKKIA